ncbi:lasso peptide biosynthesis B2 protein [Saccharopolyspora sp. K220]|uniref:lasso peptide biosynthesis B2 protein n=1 Tax=Saccharopolyspora soli TaxID=2926618 RepID=UPI001F57057D|nr:lasso peptide biosynthesis B2 protein [Saccharopolyspora soli]MCI2423726.1 lasso peptide biosynthesis B2 protein [Saccharopolyspora soli]
MLPEAPAELSLLTKAQVGLVVSISRMLSRKSPKQLRHLLERLSNGARPASYGEAKYVRDAILTASPRCRGRSACLVRSLSVVLLCRLRGTWPTWCVGVLATPPFSAHAWVEADGEIVDEPISSTDFRTFFTVSAKVAD